MRIFNEEQKSKHTKRSSVRQEYFLWEHLIWNSYLFCKKYMKNKTVKAENLIYRESGKNLKRKTNSKNI